MSEQNVIERYRMAADGTEIELEPKEAAQLAEPRRDPLTLARYARAGLIKARRFPTGLEKGRWLVRLRRERGTWRPIEIRRKRAARRA